MLFSPVERSLSNWAACWLSKSDVYSSPNGLFTKDDLLGMLERKYYRIFNTLFWVVAGYVYILNGCDNELRWKTLTNFILSRCVTFVLKEEKWD